VEDKKNPVRDIETLNYYRSLFKRYLEGRELSEKLIGEIKNSRLGWLRVVFRHYITYLFIAGKIPEETYAWIILYVPSRRYPREIRVREYNDHDIIYTFKYLREHHEKYYILYRVLIESGARLEHVLEMINTWNPEERVFVKPLNRIEKRLFCSESFCRYYLGKLEGRKQQGWVYFSKETCELVNKIAGTYMAIRPISKYARKHGLLIPSDMRKISYQWMNEVLNENITRFIQGRYGELKKQASIAHYSNLLKETDSVYPKYLSLLGKKVDLSN
jgi:intergrase/recombinase